MNDEIDIQKEKDQYMYINFSYNFSEDKGRVLLEKCKKDRLYFFLFIFRAVRTFDKKN